MLICIHVDKVVTFFQTEMLLWACFIFANENKPLVYSEWKPSRLAKVACRSQTNELGTIYYPFSHLLLQERLNDGKDAFENPRLIYDVDSLDPNWKAILWKTKQNKLHTHTHSRAHEPLLEVKGFLFPLWFSGIVSPSYCTVSYECKINLAE